MGIMDRLAKIDSSMQRGLDNGMAFVFGGRVVPAEIEELLKQETQDNPTRGDDGEIYVPNVFTVGVSSKDLENLSKDQGLPEQLADQLTRFVRNSGWNVAGPLIVRVAEESGLRTGQLRVSSFIDHEPTEETGFDAIFIEQPPEEPVEQEDDMSNSNEPNPWLADEAATSQWQVPAPAQPAQPSVSGPAVNLMLQDGSSRVYHVTEGSNIIGRSNEADLRLPDTGVSRKHAEVTWDGENAVLTDLQSTNGTTVNDTPVDNWLLADGDVITVGHSSIEVRITGTDK